MLVDRAGQVVTREQLQEHLWPSDTFVDFEHSLNTAIKELRAVLNDSAVKPRYIETLPRLGYRFVFPVERVPAETQPGPLLAAAKTEIFRSEVAPVSQKPALRRWTAPYLVAGLVIVITLSVAAIPWVRHAAHVDRVATTTKTRPSIAVLGFRNMSHGREADWMSTAMAEMLRAELASGQEVRVIAAESVARMNHDLSLPPDETFARETLLKIHDNLGTDMVVSGSYVALDDGTNTKLRILLQVQDTQSGEIIASVKEDGSQADLPQLVSSGGENLRRALGIGPLSAAAALEVRASAPSNSQAERLYAEGLSRLEDFDALAARSLLEKAITLDPGHALSHSALAESLSILGYDLQAQEQAKQAFDLSGSLAREDRLSIEGRYRELTHDYQAAVEIYRTLHGFFPDSLDYGLRLANAQTLANHPADALETLRTLHNLPGPEGKDVRVYVTEAAAGERMGDMERSQKAAAAGISRAESLGSRLMLANALNRESWAWLNLGEPDKSIADNVRARQLWLSAGDSRNAAKGLHGIGIDQQAKGDLAGARESLEKALQEFRRIGAQWDIASCSHNLGVLLLEQGQIDLARQRLEEALRIQRAQNDKRGVSFDLEDLGSVALSAGQLSLARQLKQQALEGFRKVGDKRAESIALQSLGEVLYQEGELAASAEHYSRAMDLQRKISYKIGLAYSLVGFSEVLTGEGRLDEARSFTQQSLALRQQDGEGTHSAESVIQLAEIALSQGKPAEAEELAQRAAPVFERNRAPGAASLAYSVVARARVARANLADARSAAERASALAQQAGDRMVLLQAGLATAEVDIASGQSSVAERNLTVLHQQASAAGYVALDLRARLLLAEAETRSGKIAAARPRLDQLKTDAGRRGFLPLARRANADIAN